MWRRIDESRGRPPGTNHANHGGITMRCYDRLDTPNRGRR